jgi:glycosyltransferase involved in cell wall biosynthesis
MKYLDAQLRSLIEQTRLPDCIVVSDDRSDDGTWERLNAWAEEARSARAIEVSLLRNEKRLGVTPNFEQAIRATDADIVFLADQDDIWANNKIEILAAQLESEPDVLLVHSDAFLIDEDGADLGKSLFEVLYLTREDREMARQRRFFDVYCRRNLVTGTATAFRKELLEMALPFPADWIHDEWLASCAAAWKSVAMLPDKLTYYRQHGRNAIGVPTSRLARLAHYRRRMKVLPRDEYLSNKIRRWGALHRRIDEVGGARPEAIALLTEVEQHFARRKAFSKCLPARLMSIVRESRTRSYTRFADGVAGMVRDLTLR